MQKTISLLTDEAEYGQPDTPVYEDNSTCIEWGNHVIGGRERAKHIDLSMHFAHKTIQNWMMLLIKIDISKQLADIFTKPLAYAQFIGCVRGILVDPDAMRHTKVHALQTPHTAWRLLRGSPFSLELMIESRRPL
jgi:hypothetical protein